MAVITHLQIHSRPALKRLLDDQSMVKGMTFKKSRKKLEHNFDWEHRKDGTCSASCSCLSHLASLTTASPITSLLDGTRDSRDSPGMPALHFPPIPEDIRAMAQEVQENAEMEISPSSPQHPSLLKASLCASPLKRRLAQWVSALQIYDYDDCDSQDNVLRHPHIR